MTGPLMSEEFPIVMVEFVMPVPFWNPAQLPAARPPVAEPPPPVEPPPVVPAVELPVLLPVEVPVEPVLPVVPLVVPPVVALGVPVPPVTSLVVVPVPPLLESPPLAPPFAAAALLGLIADPPQAVAESINAVRTAIQARRRRRMICDEEGACVIG